MGCSTKTKVARKAVGLAGLLLAMLILMACGLFSSVPEKLNTVATTEAGKVLATAQSAVGEALATPTGAAEAMSEATPTTEATEAPAATDMALKSEMPRSFRYGALVFSLQAAVITTKPPEGADPADKKGAYAQTVWKVSNATGDNQRVNSGAMTLKLSSGDYTKALDTTVGPQSDQDLTLVFSIPSGSTWAGASINLAEPNKVPAVLPLEGAAPALAEPTKVTVSGEAQVKSPNVLDYKLIDGATDLNGLGIRANTGTHFLLLTVTATCNDRFDCYVGPESFRILVDGAAAEAQKVDPISAAVKVNTSQDFQLAFQVPDGAKMLVLQVGEAGKDTQQIPLKLSGN